MALVGTTRSYASSVSQDTAARGGGHGPAYGDRGPGAGMSRSVSFTGVGEDGGGSVGGFSGGGSAPYGRGPAPGPYPTYGLPPVFPGATGPYAPVPAPASLQGYPGLDGGLGSAMSSASIGRWAVQSAVTASSGRGSASTGDGGFGDTHTSTSSHADHLLALAAADEVLGLSRPGDGTGSLHSGTQASGSRGPRKSDSRPGSGSGGTRRRKKEAGGASGSSSTGALGGGAGQDGKVGKDRGGGKVPSTGPAAALSSSPYATAILPPIPPKSR